MRVTSPPTPAGRGQPTPTPAPSSTPITPATPASTSLATIATNTPGVVVAEAVGGAKKGVGVVGGGGGGGGGGPGGVGKQKTFTCLECGKIFNAHYNLTRHMPVHTGARPFVCKVCVLYVCVLLYYIHRRI